MTIQFGGRPVPGFSLGGGAPDQLRPMLDELLNGVARFTRSLSPREVTILRLGLEASHLEESIVAGDWTRARAHAEKVTKLLAGLRAQ